MKTLKELKNSISRTSAPELCLHLIAHIERLEAKIDKLDSSSDPEGIEKRIRAYILENKKY